MIDLHTYLLGLALMLIASTGTWVASLVLEDVSIVDSLWGLFFIFGALVYLLAEPDLTPRAWCVFALTAIWGFRLSGYITWRSHGQPEDARYRAIRERNQPRFEIKSLYLIFGFQALLAWIVSMPLLVGISNPQPWSWLDTVGITLWCFGIAFESIADSQLAQFKSRPSNRGHVMDKGLWRYSRHPNYFGEFVIWWGAYAIALGAGAWWSIVSPLLMSFLLLRFSGVVLLEKDIGDRRPAYASYRKRTNAFIPGPTRTLHDERAE